MRSYVTTLVCTVLFLLALSPGTSHARIPGILQRLELYYTFPVTMASYERMDHFTNPTDGSITDTTIKMDVHTKASMGGGAGVSIPLKRLGKKSTFDLDVNFMYNMYTWDYAPATITSFDGTNFTYGNGALFSGVTTQMAMPIGISAKIGCDALCTKSIRFCWSVGAGVNPSYNMTSDFTDAEAQFGVQPYIKMEAGMFCIICMKLRVLAAFGDAPYLKANNSSTFGSFGFSNDTNLTSKANINISLVLMPFSFTWRHDEWWNTYKY